MRNGKKEFIVFSNLLVREWSASVIKKESNTRSLL
jgi:hypothetical protein